MNGPGVTEPRNTSTPSPGICFGANATSGDNISNAQK